jgi:ribosomal protein RSM22 (predicted rRNA methylase)
MSSEQQTRLTPSDWQELKNLRAVFLSENFLEHKNYWNSHRLLNLYHETFAQRIGWKWDSVLKEAKKKAPLAAQSQMILLDYGCGTGIASQKMVEHWGAEVFSEIWLFDQSVLAVDFAEAKLSEMVHKKPIKKFTQLTVPTTDFALCLSHVINELSPADVEPLVALAAKASFVIWLEPGTSSTSRRLVEVRGKLMGRMKVLAPCTHQNRCGMMDPENERHWCHYFAEPPKEIFQDSFWNELGRQLKIDLRSLPISYLMMMRDVDSPLIPCSGARVLGRPRIYRGNGKFLLCGDSGVKEWTLLERDHKRLFKTFKRNVFDCILPMEKQTQKN